MSRTLEVTSFKNAFAVKNRSFSFTLDEENDSRFKAGKFYVEITHNDNPVSFQMDARNDIYIFDKTFSEVDVKAYTYEDIVDTYASTTEGLKDIDSETYEKLSDNFKKKYKQVPSGKREVTVEIDYKVNDHDVDFDLSVYEGEKVSELKRLSYGKDHEFSPSFDNLSPMSLTGMEILTLLVALYHQDPESKKSIRLETRKYISSGFSYSNKNKKTLYESLEFSYFIEKYEGKMKKKKHLKQNGRPYADGRGTMVPDYPAIASTVVVISEDVKGFITGKTDDEKLEQVKALYQALTFQK